MLAHGFPDTPATWRHLGPALAEQGFLVVAPWTRGYAPTDIPEDGDYSVHARAADLNRLHDVLGGTGDAVLIGHDWGANSAYAAAAAAPERWGRVVTMAVPPEPCMHGMVRRPVDLARAWYMIAAQIPVEGVLATRRLEELLRLWRWWSPGYEPDADDVAALRSSLGHGDNLRGALSYYRVKFLQTILHRFPRQDGPVPPQPTLYLHGADDGCLRRSYADESRGVLARANPSSRVRIIDGVGHFLHLERPSLVERLVVDWVTGQG